MVSHKNIKFLKNRPQHNGLKLPYKNKTIQSLLEKMV